MLLKDENERACVFVCVFQGQAEKGDTERVGEQVSGRERDFGLVATSLFHDRNRNRDSSSPESSSLLKSTHRLSSSLPLW